jgi:hypothetical protein
LEDDGRRCALDAAVRCTAVDGDRLDRGRSAELVDRLRGHRRAERSVGYSQSDQYFGAGIFKSVDGGATWSRIGGSTFTNCYVSNIVVQPGSSATVLAAVGNAGGYVTSCVSGIYRSVNAGSTWVREENGLPTDLASKPGTPTTWYAAFYSFGI